MTRQRKIILEELRKVTTHPTAEEIHQMARRRLERISLGTVYRNLEILCGLGFVQKHESGGSQRRFDGNAENHYHLRCIRCDCLEDAPIEPTTAFDEILQDATEYRILGHRLEFFGICPRCATTPNDQSLQPTGDGT